MFSSFGNCFGFDYTLDLIRGENENRCKATAVYIGVIDRFIVQETDFVYTGWVSYYKGILREYS